MDDTGAVLSVTFVTASPELVVRVAPVKNEARVEVVWTLVSALSKVGVTVVTATPVRGVTLLTTLAKVVLTPVTHVSADAEAIAATLRLRALTASRSVRWVMRTSLHF
jgi:hypothetical protein